MKSINFYLKFILITLCLLLIASKAQSQGPELPYFYSGKASIPWATANIKFKSGSNMNVGFFPLAGPASGPFGTNVYKTDVSVNSPLVFVPSLLHRQGYDDRIVEIKDRAVLYSPELEKFSENKSSVTQNINKLIKDSVTAIILFSVEEDSPLFDLENIRFIKGEIPIIAVDRTTAFSILYANGYDIETVKESLSKNRLPVMREPIFNFELKFRGEFEIIETEHCTIRFNNNTLNSTSAQMVAESNENALKFLHKLFEELNPAKEKQLITYFSDYDEKLFYTNHWGKGLAAGKAGIFSIYDGEANDYALAVHELTHLMFNKNWGRQTSFLNEGIAMYAEAESIESENSPLPAKRVHDVTLAFLKSGKLLPIEKLTELQIGADKEYTQMGYAASGSFVGFLIKKYSLKSFHDLWRSDLQWKSAYGKELKELESEWHNWLTNN